jgi:NAD(P)-dependent dehydrogenase (short-subunit alcohol dehydrogenase family)
MEDLMGELDGRVALVTGGSRGIGAGIVRTLAEAGADVAINYHSNAAAASAVAEAVQAAGRRALLLQGDVASHDDCERMCAEALEEFGFVDILVNNAGIGATAVGRPLVAETDPADYMRLMSTHAYGSFSMSQLLVPQMRERERGDVIMISSVATSGFGATGGTYSSAKAALEALAYTLAKEERANGIRVNIVAPGLVETDMGEALVQFTRGVESIDELAANQPFGFLCQPEDIANAVLYLVSNRGRYVTNQRIAVSGGGF